MEELGFEHKPEQWRVFIDFPKFSLKARNPCLLMVAIYYNSIGLMNAQYRYNCTRAHAGHVML
jgi:hypothetical protein